MADQAHETSADSSQPRGGATASLRVSLSTLLDRWGAHEDVIIILTALVVGIGTGLSATVFVWLGVQVRNLALAIIDVVGLVPGTIGFMALAGVLVGLMVWRWAPEVRGSGVPEVMEAVAIRGARIRSRVVAAKIIATSITVGSGGSAGREGPIVLAGSSLGSTVGRMLHFSEPRVRTLVACGAAGGIAATFNAPIAGTLFAMEVILGSFTVRYFGAVVISAVAASIVSDFFIGNTPAFHVQLPAYPLYHVGEVPIYALLGVLSAVVAVVFIHVRYRVDDLFSKWRMPIPVKAATGMVLTACLGLLYPEYGILGSGLPALGRAIANNIDYSVSLMGVLLVLKILATSFTVGSGNSGGIFAPSLYIGATLGGIVGTVANTLWPNIAVNPGAYAIVGMASVFSGAARAPITSILIVFEMSGDYQLILPLMMATVLSTIIADDLYGESIYTVALKRRGVSLARGRDVDVLQSVTVGEVMSSDFDSINPEMTLDELSELFSDTHRHGFPIVDKKGVLCGLVTITNLDRAIADHLPHDTTVAEIGVARAQLLTATPDESMGEALTRMGRRGLGRLPVIDPEDPNRLVGLIRRSDIIRAYNIALSRRADLQYRAKRMTLRDIDGTVFTDIHLHNGDRAVGKRVSELSPDFPQECILVSVRRNGRMLIPHGDTVFQPGDRVTVFVSATDEIAIQRCLRGNGDRTKRKA